MNAYRRSTYTPAGTPDPADAPATAPDAGPIDHADALRRWHTTNPGSTR